MDIKPIKMRARLKDDAASVKCLMPHPMETGVRKGLDGNRVPAHYIETVRCKHNGEVIIAADWGPSVSRDPYFGFEVASAKAGDVIEVSWQDNQGNSTATDLTLEER